MKRNTLLVTALSLAVVTLFTACGDDSPADSLTDADVACAKVQAAGGTCSGTSTSSSTSTETLTLTTTNTSTATTTTTVTATS